LKTHLTIDLDYFSNLVIDNIELGHDFLKKIFFKFDPDIIQTHEEVIPLLNTSKYSKIINVDFHSDIVGQLPLP